MCSGESIDFQTLHMYTYIKQMLRLILVIVDKMFKGFLNDHIMILSNDRDHVDYVGSNSSKIHKLHYRMS